MKLFLIFILIASISNSFSHGGGKPGPHGGHIQMPGSFHTELVLENDNAKVFLLDINFKNPTTVDSKIHVRAQNKTKKENDEVSCVKKVNHFECPLKNLLSTYSQISIKATRNGKTGSEAIYELPLTFPKQTKQVPDKTKHHH